MSTPGLTPRRKRGLPWGTMDVEDAARNCSRYGHHVQPRHHMVDIGSTGKCFCKEGPEKRCSPMGKPSQCVWEQVAHLRQGRPCHQKATGYQSQMQEGPLCLWSQLDIALNRHHCLAEVGRPALWRSPCALPRVQRGVKRINSVRQRSNFCPLLASHPIGSLHGDRPMWHHFRHRRV